MPILYPFCLRYVKPGWNIILLFIEEHYMYREQCDVTLLLMLVYFDMYTGFRCCDISFFISTNMLNPFIFY